MKAAVKVLSAALIISLLWGAHQCNKNKMEWFEARNMRESVILAGFGQHKLQDDLRECRVLLMQLEQVAPK